MSWLSRHAKLILSLAVLSLSLAYCVHIVDLAAFRAALSNIDALGFLAFMGVYTIGLLVADSLAVWQVFARYVQPIPFREVFILRGASYGPSALNYHLGQASITWLLSSVRGAPVWRVAGATLLGYASMFGGLVVLCMLAPLLAPDELSWLLPVLAALGLGALAYFWLLRPGSALPQRWEPTRLLAEAGLAGHLVALAWRMPHVLWLFAGYWLPFAFFDVDVPVGAALAFVPPLLLVGALPLTPQGVGTREALAIQLLATYAPGEGAQAASAVAAASLSWAVALSLWEVVIALSLAAAAHRILHSDKTATS